MEFGARHLLGLIVVVVLVSGASHWWASRHEASAGQQLAALAAPGDIRMISSQFCGPCTAARRWLTQHAVPFNECFIEKDAVCRQTFENLGAPGTPLLLVRGQPQLGFSPPRLQAALQPGA